MAQGVAMQGTDIIALNSALLEHFNPGDRVQVLLGISHDLSDEELAQIALKMRDNGLGIEKFTFGPSTTWPYSLTFEFTRPARQGYGFILLGVWLVGVVGALAFGAVLGWQITQTIRNNFIPTLVIGGVLWLAYILRPQLPEIITAARRESSRRS